MGSKIEYVDATQMYAASYARNSKAVGVLWAVFTVCYAIIGVVAFVTPEWVGAADGGRVGLWATCPQQIDAAAGCSGRLDDFAAIPSTAFKAATALVGAAVVAALLTIAATPLFLFCHSTTVFHVSGWLQLVSASCMIAGCSVFPAGWSDSDVRKICGEEADRYALGTCGIRWAYLLSAIGCLDAAILATLAFILATRHVTLQPEPNYSTTPSLFKGEMNSAFLGDSASVAGSRKSLGPVLMIHPSQDDTYSQFSQRTVPRSIHSGHYSHPHSLHRNFQL